MTSEEFSNEFDVLIDSYRRFKDFDDRQNLDSIEFNEYEKSVFLTKAQEDLVRDIYNGIFESSESSMEYLKNLIKQVTPSQSSNQSNLILPNNLKSYLYDCPTDLMFIVYESAELSSNTCASTKQALVTPVTHDSFYSTFKNPFKGPSKTRILRLLSENKIELVASDTIEANKYLLRYIRYPKPIILDGCDSSAFNETNYSFTVELPTSLHRTVLERATKLALMSKTQLSNNN